MLPPLLLLLLLPALGCSLHLKGTYEQPGGDAGTDAEDAHHDHGDLDAEVDADAGTDADPREDPVEDPVFPDEGDAADMPPDEAGEDPEEEEPGCPGGCSGHGECVGGACICDPGYAPPACDRCAEDYTGYPDCVHCGYLGEPCCDGGTCLGELDCVGGTCSTACPADMARIGETGMCIDRYEASRHGSTARSLAGAAPWASVTHGAAAGGCTNAGKRLCTSSEWSSACSGPGGTHFPYGDAFQAGWCNDMNGGSCIMDGSGVLPAGSLSTCEGGYPGIFDMSGNVWEWVSDTGSGWCGLMGGSVDSCRDAGTLNCGDLEWQECGLEWPGLGFRCCLTLD